ncbi:MAG TPA: hypothetical protein VMV29_17100 [Ktedonobacterales bacterium]|nr:hypothetical protein [Ktedonobacterales bacterium]
MRDARGSSGSNESQEPQEPNTTGAPHEPNDAPLQRGDDPPDEDHSAASPRPALGQAIAGWRRRGFALRYLDETLAQLTRREPPDWDVIALALGALGALGLAGWLLRLAWRRWRRWSAVSLTVTPDDRVITHRQFTRRRPQL